MSNQQYYPNLFKFILIYTNDTGSASHFSFNRYTPKSFQSLTGFWTRCCFNNNPWIPSKVGVSGRNCKLWKKKNETQDRSYQRNSTPNQRGLSPWCKIFPKSSNIYWFVMFILPWNVKKVWELFQSFDKTSKEKKISKHQKPREQSKESLN